MAERLTPRILDQEVRCSSLTCCVVSLSKELYSTLSPFIQVYKLYGYRRYTAGGVTRRWTSIPSIGECNTPRLASWYGSRNMISSGRVGLWLVCTFTLFYRFYAHSLYRACARFERYSSKSFYGGLVFSSVYKKIILVKHPQKYGISSYNNNELVF